MSPTPAILILAAGASARMGGRDKLMEPVGGQALVCDRVAAAQSTGAAVFVTLPPRRSAPARWAALEPSGVRRVAVARAGDGMAASLCAGVAALPRDCPGVLVVLADMPEITGPDMAAVLGRSDGTAIVRGASEDGTPGHPVLFPARDFPALRALTGDRGAREVLQQAAARVRLVPLPARHALTDLDTPADWAAWRAARS